MLELGFVTAILPDLSFEEVVAFAAAEQFHSIEVMCWPKGKAERRYAGVCHLDVSRFSDDDAHRVRDLLHIHQVAISALGYYPKKVAKSQPQKKFQKPTPSSRR